MVMDLIGVSAVLLQFKSSVIFDHHLKHHVITSYTLVTFRTIMNLIISRSTSTFVLNRSVVLVICAFKFLRITTQLPVLFWPTVLNLTQDYFALHPTHPGLKCKCTDSSRLKVFRANIIPEVKSVFKGRESKRTYSDWRQVPCKIKTLRNSAAGIPVLKRGSASRTKSRQKRKKSNSLKKKRKKERKYCSVLTEMKRY